MTRIHGEIFKRFIENLNEKDLDLDRMIRGKPRLKEPDHSNDDMLDVENTDDYNKIMTTYEKINSEKSSEENNKEED